MKNEEKSINTNKLYYLEINSEQNKSQNYFSSLKEINLNKNFIKEFKLKKEYAIAITKNNELIQWQIDKNSNKDDNNDYLSINPSFIFNKIKFKSITLNSTMCLAINNQFKVMVWGHNSNGLLGLGYDITSLESPTYINELKNINITEISLSENHAVALTNSGIAYSWGLGKYGELGQERTIYTPFPLQINTDNLYSKVFCYNFVTCFINFEGHFSYFGVIIRNLETDNNNINLTIKNLLEDESMHDGRTLIREITIEEIENEKVIKIVIGNGFAGILCESGDLYVLEYKDKLTKLYNKYFCYDIAIYNNKIYGLAINNSYNNNYYYICQWSVNYTSGNLLSGVTWNSTFWIMKGDSELIFNLKLIELNNGYENINKIFILDMNKNNVKNNHKKIDFEFDSIYDDSYNLRFKRAKSKNSTMINDISLITDNKNKFNHYKPLNKTYNNSCRYNYNYSLYKPFNNIEVNKPKNENNRKSKNNINIVKNQARYNNNEIYPNKENIDININQDINKYKEYELNNYRKEIDNVINKFKNKQNFKSKSSLENNVSNIKNGENIQSRGIFSKTNIPSLGNNNKNKNNIKSNNSKDYLNNINNSNYTNNNKKNPGNNNNNNSQKEIYTNIDDYFGKESSNIIKNDDIFSDLNEFSNTNFNYLCNNIDASNKIYNGNNSNNLLINSDRTLNFSNNNYLRRNNHRNSSPRFLNGYESINLNSITSGKIDKSNDFFSEYGLGKKQGRNNYNENNMNKKELIKISKESKIYKTKTLNIDILDSNMESNKKSDQNKSDNKYQKESNIIDHEKSRSITQRLYSELIGTNIIQRIIFYTYNSNNNMKYKLRMSTDKNCLNINYSFPNLLTANKKNIKKNNKLIHPLEENDFLLNEGRKTGKFYFSNEKKVIEEDNNKNKYISDKNFIRKYLPYFCFLVKIYMKKIIFEECIKEINEYTRLLDKKYATKMIFRIIKRRIVFYEIKLYRRLKKIRKFYIKYEQRLKLMKNQK